MTAASLYTPPEDHVSIAKLRRFYPSSITVSHHQLRNFISTVYHNKVFFVNKDEVFRLDFDTNQRSLVATIPFEARCLAARHGWICVGGETKGDCAFIFIGEEDGQPGSVYHDLFHEKLGREIVNSMTIHKLEPPPGSDKKDEIIALISNNDKTVTVYSLSQRLILTTLPHPNPMNYATISPDGQLLVAVGDENAAYFYIRKAIEPTRSKKDLSDAYLAYEWLLIAVPSVPMGDEEMDDYSFSVAFSPSGHLCATSSQGGGITIFSTSAILDGIEPSEDAIISSFRSSRPTVYGCVRSMAFSPNPWDILAWTEDHGRIGLADVRTGFVRRQPLDLSKHKGKEVDVQDTMPKDRKSLADKERLTRQHHARLAATRGQPPVGARSFFDNNQTTPGDEPGQTRHSQPSTDAALQEHLDRDSSFSARERSVLEALETAMGDHISAARRSPFSINYTSNPSLRPSASTEGQDYTDEALGSTQSGFSTARAPRRRSSVMLSELPSRQHFLSVDDQTRATMTASPGPMSDDGSVPPMSTNDLTPSHGASSQPLPYNIPPSDPWHIIERTLREQAASTSLSRQHVPLSHIEAAITAERQISDRLENQLRDERRLSILLRQELEARERLLEARRHELQQTRAISPMEFSPHRMLEHDRQSAHSRLSGRNAEEELLRLERNNQARIRQALSQHHGFGTSNLNQSIEPNSPSTTEEQRQSLQRQQPDGPTEDSPQLTSTISPTTGAPTMSQDLEQTLRHLEEERRVRRARISELESQAARTESRVALASSESTTQDSAAQIRGSRMWSSDGRPIPPRPTTQNQPLPSFVTATPLDPAERAAMQAQVSMRMRALAANSATRVSPFPTPPRAPPNPRETRRLLQHAAMDGNGNWQSSAFQRAIAGRLSAIAAGSTLSSSTPSLAQFRNFEARPPEAVNRITTGTGTLEDMIGEIGLGTAGIGWSDDGMTLFVGSTDGIFEFDLNVMDRMQTPDLEMR